MKISAEIPQKTLKTDSAIPVLGVGSKDSTAHCRDPCTSIFIAALFTIAKTWNQPRHLSTDGIMKMRLMCTMEFYVAINQNKL